MRLISLESGETTYVVELTQTDLDVVVALVGATNSLGDNDAEASTEDLYGSLFCHREIGYEVNGASDGLSLKRKGG